MKLKTNSEKETRPDFFSYFLVPDLLEGLLPEVEAKVLALLPEGVRQLRVAAVEDGDLAAALVPQLTEHPVPVGPSGVGPGLQAGHKILLLLKRQRLCQF